MTSRHSPSNMEIISSPAAQFDEIAFLYDELMAGVPYRSWVSYLHKILDHLHYAPETILDLCCGTGTVSLLLAREGYKVTGVDISPEMIHAARNRAESGGVSADFHVQNASALRLGRKFDLVISLFDSLNYILDSSSLQEAFHRVSDHMEPGGLFIFDMNTELALAAGLFDQSNYGSRSPVLYDWQSSYDQAARICRIRMDFVYRRGGNEKRVQVVHYQRAYDQEEIVDMLRTSGLETIAVYDAYTFRKATRRSDRAFFVARK